MATKGKWQRQRFLTATISLRASPVVKDAPANPSSPQTYIWATIFRNLVVHGDAREGKWRRNWRMEWVASTLTPPPNVIYPTLLKLMYTPRLPADDWTDAPTDLNGLVRFGEGRNLVSARVPSRSVRAILTRTSQNIACPEIPLVLVRLDSYAVYITHKSKRPTASRKYIVAIYYSQWHNMY